MTAGGVALTPGSMVPGWVAPLVLALLLTLLPRSLAAQSLDHYTLVMGWLPGRCLVDPGFSPCKDLSIRDPFGRDLNLIGLRPDPRPGAVALQSCDPMARAFSEPVFPGEEGEPGNRACRLPQLNLSEELDAELAAVSPMHGQCAERQFWVRHGSCSLLSQERYFQRAVSRARDVQQGTLNLAIGAAMGGEVDEAQLAAAFEQQFGTDSARSMALVCGRTKTGNRPVLTEVHIALTQIGTMRPLETGGLWHDSKMRVRKRCPGRFLVAAPGTAGAETQTVTPGPQSGTPGGTQPPVAMPSVPAVLPPAPVPLPADPTLPQPMLSEPVHIEPVTP